MPSRSLCIATLVLAAAASPGLAQQTQSAGRVGQIGGACGQPLALTYTLPLPLDQTAMAPLTAELARGEPAYLEFALAGEARVVLRSDAADAGSDPYLTVFSPAGEVLAQDDDSAGGFDALVDLTLPPGSYCARIEPYAASASGTVTMTLLAATGEAAAELASRPAEGAPADAALLCGDPALLLDAGGAVGPGFGTRTLQATLGAGSRQDWRIEVAEATDFQADATSAAIDTLLRLVRDGQTVAENDDGPSGTDSRIALRLDPGSYCLSLSSYDGSAGAATVTLTDTPSSPIVGDITTACTDPALTSAFGTPLASGLGTVTAGGALEPGGRSDWTIEVAEAVLVQLDARSADFDTRITLLDAGGQLLDTNDDGPAGTDSRLVRELGPGAYCLAVESYDGSGGTFDIVASDSIEAPPADLGAAAGCSDPATTADLGRGVAPGLESVTLPVTLAPNGRQDWRITVAERTALRLDARSAAFDTTLTLTDSAGSIVGENDDSPEGGTDSRIDVTLAPGSYCLSLEGFAGAGGAAEVALTEGGGGAAPDDAPAVTPPGPNSGVAVEELGLLETLLQANQLSADQTKWVAFEVAGDAAVRIDAVSVGGSFVLRLFDEGGALVAETAGFGMAPAQLAARLAPGRYTMGMTMDQPAATMLRSITITRSDR